MLSAVSRFFVFDRASASLPVRDLIARLGDRAVNFYWVWALVFITHNSWLKLPEPIWVAAWVFWLFALITIIRALRLWAPRMLHEDIELGASRWFVIILMVITVVAPLIDGG